MDKSSPISIVAPYNMIIARYVEIGLKSRKVRNRMEQRLLKHIQAILSRESVKCEKAYCKWGRLIFEISAQEMEKTLLIFRNKTGNYCNTFEIIKCFKPVYFYSCYHIYPF